MILYHKSMIVDYRNAEVIIDNITIQQVTSFKLLGVWADNNLTFTTHCIKFKSSINSYKYFCTKWNYYVIPVYYKLFKWHVYLADKITVY